MKELPAVLGTITDHELARILEMDERTGTVDRKRSILNKDPGRLDKLERTAVALVNGNPERPVFLIFGQEDDYTVCGQVDHELKPLSGETVRACQRRFDQRLQACMPPVQVRWQKVVSGDHTVWIACMMGRRRGAAVRTSTGAYPYRSGEDTHLASPETIAEWTRDRGTGSAVAQSGAEAASPDLRVSDRHGEPRKVLRLLQDAVDDFFRNPPVLPDRVVGESVDAWKPVVDPILGHFRTVMDGVVQFAVESDEEALERLMRGVRSVFELPDSRSGLTWLVEAPRVITRLIADRVMVEAYCTESWSRLWSVGFPLFDSYLGPMPWVISPEYRHLQTLGSRATTCDELSVTEIKAHSEGLRDAGVTDAQLVSNYSALSLGLALGTMARVEAGAERRRADTWAAVLAGVWREFRTWEEEPDLVDAFAKLGGEHSTNFRVQMPRRLQQIISVLWSSGCHVHMTDEAKAAVERIAGEAGSDKVTWE